MSQRRQESRRAEQDRRREERRKQRVDQRRQRATSGPSTASGTPLVNTTQTAAQRVAKMSKSAPARPPRRIKPLWIAGGVGGGLVLAAVALWFFTVKASPLPGEKFESNGNEHVQQGGAHGSYFSNPPTSGWHLEEIPRPGIYDQPRSPESLGHHMEHGGIWVLYRPDTDQATIKQLQELVQQRLDDKKPVSLAPYPAPGYAVPEKPINVIAWQYLLAMDSVDAGKINDFIDRHACRYIPEASGYGCPATVRGSTGPAKDAGGEGFNPAAAGATPAPGASAVPGGASGPTPAPGAVMTRTATPSPAATPAR